MEFQLWQGIDIKEVERGKLHFNIKTFNIWRQNLLFPSLLIFNQEGSLGFLVYIFEEIRVTFLIQGKSKNEQIYSVLKTLNLKSSFMSLLTPTPSCRDLPISESIALPTRNTGIKNWKWSLRGTRMLDDKVEKDKPEMSCSIGCKQNSTKAYVGWNRASENMALIITT